MGKIGDTWRGVEMFTKTAETDQGVTPLDLCVLGSCWGIVRLLVRYYCTVGTRSTSILLLALTSANHVYVTNKMWFDLYITDHLRLGNAFSDGSDQNVLVFSECFWLSMYLVIWIWRSWQRAEDSNCESNYSLNLLNITEIRNHFCDLYTKCQGLNGTWWYTIFIEHHGTSFKSSLYFWSPQNSLYAEHYKVSAGQMLFYPFSKCHQLLSHVWGGKVTGRNAPDPEANGDTILLIFSKQRRETMDID